MESSKNNRVEKRGYELVEEGDDVQHHLTQTKKPKLPVLARYFSIQFSNIPSLIMTFFKKNWVILLQIYCGVWVLYACVCVCLWQLFLDRQKLVVRILVYDSLVTCLDWFPILCVAVKIISTWYSWNTRFLVKDAIGT